MPNIHDIVTLHNSPYLVTSLGGRYVLAIGLSGVTHVVTHLYLETYGKGIVPHSVWSAWNNEGISVKGTIYRTFIRHVDSLPSGLNVFCVQGKENSY